MIRRIEGQDVRVAPIEAVILGKLRYFQIGGSERHLRDIARMVQVSGDLIDKPVLDHWVEQLELSDAWTKALAFGDR